MNWFETIEKEIEEVTKRFHDKLPDDKIEEIYDLLKHAEYGIALEYLTNDLYEYEIWLTIGHRMQALQCETILGKGTQGAICIGKSPIYA